MPHLTSPGGGTIYALAHGGAGLCALRCGGQMSSLPGSASCVRMVSSLGGGLQGRLDAEEPSWALLCLTQSLIDTWDY